MTTLTLNTTTYQDNLIAEYLKEHNTKLEDLVTSLLLEKLEDEADLKALEKSQEIISPTPQIHGNMVKA